MKHGLNSNKNLINYLNIPNLFRSPFILCVVQLLCIHSATFFSLKKKYWFHLILFLNVFTSWLCSFVYNYIFPLIFFFRLIFFVYSAYYKTKINCITTIKRIKWIFFNSWATLNLKVVKSTRKVLLESIKNYCDTKIYALSLEISLKMTLIKEWISWHFHFPFFFK